MLVDSWPCCCTDKGISCTFYSTDNLWLDFDRLRSIRTALEANHTGRNIHRVRSGILSSNYTLGDFLGKCHNEDTHRLVCYSLYSTCRAACVYCKSDMRNFRTHTTWFVFCILCRSP